MCQTGTTATTSFGERVFTSAWPAPTPQQVCGMDTAWRRPVPKMPPWKGRDETCQGLLPQGWWKKQVEVSSGIAKCSDTVINPCCCPSCLPGKCSFNPPFLKCALLGSKSGKEIEACAQGTAVLPWPESEAVRLGLIHIHLNISLGEYQESHQSLLESAGELGTSGRCFSSQDWYLE